MAIDILQDRPVPLTTENDKNYVESEYCRFLLCSNLSPEISNSLTLFSFYFIFKLFEFAPCMKVALVILELFHNGKAHVAVETVHKSN